MNSSPFKPQKRSSVERDRIKYEVAAAAYYAMENLIATLEERTSEALGRVEAIDHRCEGPLHPADYGFFLEQYRSAMDAYKAVLAERNAAYVERVPLFRAMNRAELALDWARDAERQQDRGGMNSSIPPFAKTFVTLYAHPTKPSIREVLALWPEGEEKPSYDRCRSLVNKLEATIAEQKALYPKGRFSALPLYKKRTPTAEDYLELGLSPPPTARASAPSEQNEQL